MDVAVGDRVKHPTLHEQWGPGEVLGVSGGKVTVHFALAGQKILKGVALEVLSGNDAVHPLLDNRKGPSKRSRPPKSLAVMKEAFLRRFPGGFEDSRYLEEERNPKVEAGALLASTLGPADFTALLGKKDFGEVAKRALAVVNATSLILPGEKTLLRDGLADKRGREQFARALHDLLHGTSEVQARFEAFAAALEQIGANKWPLATCFLFLAFPKEQTFLKPDVTKRATDACNFELNYRVELNWITYLSMLRFTKAIEEMIADMKPRDNIDIQAFVFSIGERA